MIATHTAPTAFSAPALVRNPAPESLAQRLLNWLIAKDQAFRTEAHFKTLDTAALKDVGLLS